MKAAILREAIEQGNLELLAQLHQDDALCFLRPAHPQEGELVSVMRLVWVQKSQAYDTMESLLFTTLSKAIENNDGNTLEMCYTHWGLHCFVKNEISLEGADHKCNALQLAAFKNKKEALELAVSFVKKFFDDWSSADVLNPHRIIYYGMYHPEILEYCITEGADIDIESFLLGRSNIRITPLIQAYLAGRKDIMEKLLHHGASLRTLINSGFNFLENPENPILLALNKEIEEVKNAITSYDLPKLQSVLTNNPILLLPIYNKDPNHQNLTPLTLAAMSCNMELINALVPMYLKRWKMPETNHHRFGHWERDDEGFFGTFVKNVVSQEEKEQQDLKISQYEKTCQLNDLLTTSQLIPVVAYSSKSGGVSIAAYCLKSRVDVNLSAFPAVDGHCYTPLHYAAWNNNVELLDFLLENGANVDANVNQIRPWEMHCEEGNKNPLLVKINALNQAILANDLETLKAIVKQNESWETIALNANQETALHVAAKVGSEKIVNYLKNLSYQSNQNYLTRKDASGHTPSDYCKEWTEKKQVFLESIQSRDLKAVQQFVSQNEGWWYLDIDTVEWMHRYKTKKNALQLASYPYYNKQIFDYLLSKIPNEQLEVGSFLCSIPIYSLPSRHGENYDQFWNDFFVVNENALQKAILEGNLKWVNYFVAKNKALITEACFHDNKTALHIAASCQRQDLFDYLLMQLPPYRRQEAKAVKDRAQKTPEDYFDKAPVPLSTFEGLLKALKSDQEEKIAKTFLCNQAHLEILVAASPKKLAEFLSYLNPEEIGLFENALFFSNQSYFTQCWYSNIYHGFFERLFAYLFEGYKTGLDRKYYATIVNELSPLGKAYVYNHGLLGQNKDYELAKRHYNEVPEQSPRQRILALYELANLYLADNSLHVFQVTRLQLNESLKNYLTIHEEDATLLRIKHFSKQWDEDIPHPEMNTDAQYSRSLQFFPAQTQKAPNLSYPDDLDREGRYEHARDI